MKNQKGFTLIELIIAVFAILYLVLWPWNFYKLTQCNFESDWKCEAIHGFGVIVPPAAAVTVWFGTDE